MLNDKIEKNSLKKNHENPDKPFKLRQRFQTRNLLNPRL
jgi:hypothetical protein